jgi:cyclase
MKKILITVAVIVVLIIAAAAALYYPAIHSLMQKETVVIDPTLTLMLGGGGNSGIVTGDSAVVVIDTKMMGAAEELYKLAKEKAGTKPIIVINTHYHGDHTGGNKYYKESRIYIGDYDRDFLQKNIDAENRPTDFVKDSLLINTGNEQVRVYNLGRGHTFEDMVVYLSGHNTLFTGDLIFNRRNPVLKAEGGASVSDWIRKLDIILARWGGGRIVPGHGPAGDKEMVVAMRQYFIDMTDAAKNPEKEKQLAAKYSDWTTMPGFSSPENTIAFIKKTEMK